MKKLERKFETIVKRLRKRYSFLSDYSIDVCEGYGLGIATTFNPRQRSINIDLLALRKLYNTPRFVKRLGKRSTFEQFVLVVLLHEIAHVKQFETIAPYKLNTSINQIEPLDAASHDESWVEQEADKWARREFRKIETEKK